MKQRYLLFALALGVLAKLGYSHAEADQLVWVLKPTSWLVRLFFHEPFSFQGADGYVFAQHGIAITRECAGVNFLIVLAAATIGTLPPQLPQRWQRILAVPLLLLLSYGVTVLANTSRILSLHFSEPFQSLIHTDYSTMVHAGIGTVVYLGFLMAAYFVFTRFSHKLSDSSLT